MVGIDGLGELVDCWWDLKTAHEDSLLSLDADILWPSDETGQVLCLDDIATNSEVSWVLLEKRLRITTLSLGDNHLLGNLLDLCQQHGKRSIFKRETLSRSKEHKYIKLQIGLRITLSSLQRWRAQHHSV